MEWSARWTKALPDFRQSSPLESRPRCSACLASLRTLVADTAPVEMTPKITHTA